MKVRVLIKVIVYIFLVSKNGKNKCKMWRVIIKMMLRCIVLALSFFNKMSKLKSFGTGSKH